MAIDARIEAVRHKPHKHILWLVKRDKYSIAGRRELHVTRNPEYVPQVGDEIWGGAHECMIGPHEFRRVSVMWDGTEQVR